jgi:hypothetical protein
MMELLLKSVFHRRRKTRVVTPTQAPYFPCQTAEKCEAGALSLIGIRVMKNRSAGRFSQAAFEFKRQGGRFQPCRDDEVGTCPVISAFA